LISNFGNIFNKSTGEFLKLYPCATSSNGKFYYSVNLKTISGFKSYHVHRLVIACFFPNLGPITQKMDVNHKDGIKTNNYVNPEDYSSGNVEWMTRSENIKHAYETGLHGVGEEHTNAKLTNEIALKVIELLDTGKYTSRQICEIINYHGLETYVVDDIRKKTSYKYLSQGHEFKQQVRVRHKK
jgi:hypothetical protein